MLKKITIIAVLLFTIFVSPAASVQAQTDNTSNIPETNPFCWRKSDCEKFRKQFGTSNDKSGFVSDVSVAPCVGGDPKDPWGRCLPAGTSKTEISFGGQAEFANIGVFILVMYKYLLTMDSIVAVVMVIIAGMQWITSGGNSEAIGSAKKRIAGSIIGLFIAYMSYFVLNTINPALVNLRLPQVWMIKPVSLTPQFCMDLPGAKEGKINFAFVSGPNESKKPVPPPNQRKYEKPIITSDDSSLVCGSRFLIEGGGETPCFRDGACPIVDGEKQMCFDQNGERNAYICGKGRITGVVSYTPGVVSSIWGFLGGLITNDWTKDPVVQSWLKVVCKQGDVPSALRGDGPETKNYYVVEVTTAEINSLAQECAGSGGVNGFAVGIELARQGQNEYHYIGKGGEDLGWAHAAYGVGVESTMGSDVKIFFDKNAYKINGDKFLFSIDDLKKRQNLPINANEIINISDTMTKENRDGIIKEYQKYWLPQYQK